MTVGFSLFKPPSDMSEAFTVGDVVAQYGSDGILVVTASD
jgi:hypothetical protein